MGRARQVMIRIIQGAWAFLAAVALLEIGLRATAGWEPGYYDIRRDPGMTVRYPYGEYKLDPWGFPDDRPQPNDARARVAWIGDSALYGVGCPQDQRFTEQLERLDPGTNHLNLGFPGFSGEPASEWETALKLAIRLGATRAVWAFNLNDVLPPKDRPTDGWRIARLPGGAWFSGTWVWTAADASLASVQVRAFGSHPIENFPKENALWFEVTANRVREVAAAFGRASIPLRVVILPYEMQVSPKAAAYYAAHGVTWEDGFLDGTAQAKLIELLPTLDVTDARAAFAGADDPGPGVWYVADGGGRLDWNHLTAAGHARVARWLVDSGWEGQLYQ